jgi:hypothetical protein
LAFEVSFSVGLKLTLSTTLIDGHSSNWAPVKSGVLQGSILGPLLFLIYVNDIGLYLNSSVRLFADDCTIFREVRNSTDCDMLQKDLDILFQWTEDWQLSLNLPKCRAMRFTNKKNTIGYDYCLNGNPLEWCKCYKYFGVILNSHITWEKQTSEVKAKASRIQNLLRRTMYGCSKAAKSRAYMYVSLVRPHLDYCAPVWSPHQAKLMDTLESVQKQSARWICVTWDLDQYRWPKSYED